MPRAADFLFRRSKKGAVECGMRGARGAMRDTGRSTRCIVVVETRVVLAHIARMNSRAMASRLSERQAWGGFQVRSVGARVSHRTSFSRDGCLGTFLSRYTQLQPSLRLHANTKKTVSLTVHLDVEGVEQSQYRSQAVSRALCFCQHRRETMLAGSSPR